MWNGGECPHSIKDWSRLVMGAQRLQLFEKGNDLFWFDPISLTYDLIPEKWQYLLKALRHGHRSSVEQLIRHTSKEKQSDMFSLIKTWDSLWQTKPDPAHSPSCACWNLTLLTTKASVPPRHYWISPRILRYEPPDCMSEKTVLSTFQFFMARLPEETRRVNIYIGIGGEPLQKMSLCKLIEAACLRESQKSGVEFHIRLYTNGIVINDEAYRFLLHTKISDIGICMDGCGFVPDSNTVYVTGNPFDHQETMNTVTSLLRARGFNADRLYAVSRLSGVNPQFRDCMEYLMNVGFKKIAMIPSLDSGTLHDLAEDNLADFHEGYEKLALFLIDMSKDGKWNPGYCFHDEDFFWQIWRRVLLHQPVFRRCQGVHTAFMIDSNGDIYGCERFISDRDQPLGSVFQDNLSILCEPVPPVAEVESCHNCWLRNLCGGPCSLLGREGEARKAGTVLCELIRRLAEVAIWLTLFLRDSNPAAYQRIISQVLGEAR